MNVGEYRLERLNHISGLDTLISDNLQNCTTNILQCLRMCDFNNNNNEMIKILDNNDYWGLMGRYLEKGFPLQFIDLQLLNFLGYTSEEFLQETNGLAINIIHEADRERVEKTIYDQIQLNHKYEIKYRIMKKNKDYIWVIDKGKSAISAEGKHIVSSVLVDQANHLMAFKKLLQDKKLCEQVESQSRFLQSIYQTIPSGVVQYIEEDGMRILNANDATFELFGYTREEFAKEFQNRIVHIIHKDDYAYMNHTMKSIQLNKTKKVEYRIITKGNKIKWIHAEASRLLNEDQLEIIQVVYIDISEFKIKELEKRIKNAIDKDALTNFYSNKYGQNLIRQYLKEKSDGEECVLFVLDMDNFALINDTYGVMFGNTLLKEVTEIIRKVTKPEDILVRFGGDEILIFLTNTNRKQSFAVADTLCESVKKIYCGENKDIKMSCSIGIAGTKQTSDYEELHNNAIMALEYAKQVNMGKYSCYYDTMSIVNKETKEEYLSKHLVHEIKENSNDMEQDIITFAFALLEKTKDLPSGINLLLSRIGKLYHLDRVSVTEIDVDYLSLQYTYQWSDDEDYSTIGNTYYLSKEMYSQFESMYDSTNTGETKNGLYSLKSCIHSPIYEKGIYRGSVCFEKNADDFIWSEDMKRLLKEISKVISTYTLKIKADSVSQAKTDFLSRMSHEIRTPMNAITGMTSIAKSVIEDRSKVEECLNKIDYSTKYLISLVNDILDMSKIESGKMVILNQSFDLKKLVEEIEVIMQSQVDAKKIHFTIEEKYDNSILIGDELRLSQVLINILGNAVKFTEERGYILFRIEQLVQEEDSAVIRFSVKDSGIGISKENVKRIFNSFEQADSNIAKEYGGTGLGLSISSNLVRKMGGNLEVKSKYKSGSEFFFTINFSLGNTEDINKKENSTNEEEETFDFGGKRVLVVEDNSLNMEIEKSLLEMTGCIVEEAKNGQEAVESFKKNPVKYYDLILMDIRMPVMNGLEATKLIRTSEKEDARTVPIIATTANAFDEDTKKSMDSGMDGHISKPIEIKYLYEMVNKAIKCRNSAEENKTG